MKREWKQMSAAEYHAAEGLSSSALRCRISEGRLKYYARYVAKTLPVKDTEAMRLGRAFHKAMECPDTWLDYCALMPQRVPDDERTQSINLALKAAKSKAGQLVVGAEWDWKNKSPRDYRDGFVKDAEASGREFMGPDDFNKVQAQVAAVYDSAVCREWLQGPQIQNEVACFSHSDKLPWPLKALIDKDSPQSIIDFKATCEADVRGFIKDALFKRRYDLQMAYYGLVTGRPEARLIAVTSEPPWEANLFVIDEKRMRQLVEVVKEHVLALAHDFTDDDFTDEKDVDAAGVPSKWHNDLWNSEIPLDLAIASGATVEN